MNLDGLINISFLVKNYFFIYNKFLLMYYVEVYKFNINYLTCSMLVYYFVCLAFLVLFNKSESKEEDTPDDKN
jgi:Ca2+/Na+ antiporter